ncbi:hypothetical protein HK098_008099 [Nowakowskiella sp. JEL0407]|nr:hypothetical protein HK098_008099 [Nowakowskiella sp. JEL0407]
MSSVNTPTDQPVIPTKEGRALPKRTASMAEIPKPPQKFEDIAEVVAKIMILGDSGTGKSKLFCRLRKRPFNSHYNPTPGIDFATHNVKISNGKHMRAQIVDTSGLDRYRTIVQNYWSLARGAIIVFDLTSNDSFTAVRRWVSDFKAKACPTGSGRPKPPIMIIGNKMDLEAERQVSTSNARSYAVANGFFYTETSAKDDINVDIAFNVLLTEVYFEILKQQKPVALTLKNEAAETGFMEATVSTFARIGRSLSSKRKSNTPKNDGAISGSPLGPSRSGRDSPFNDEASEGRRGRPELRSQSALGHVKLDETFVSGARTLWKWVGDVVDDFVDEIEGVPIETENDGEFFVNPVEFKTPNTYTGKNPMIGVVAPPTRKFDGSGSEGGSNLEFDSEDSDEGQAVMDFFSGNVSNKKSRHPRIPPRSESSTSGSPPRSPMSSLGNEFAINNSNSPFFSPVYSEPRRGSMAKILPRRESLVPASLRTPPQSPMAGHSNQRASPTANSHDEHKETSKSIRSAQSHVVEVSSITPIFGSGIEGDGARSLIENFVSMNVLDSSSDTLVDLGDVPGQSTWVERLTSSGNIYYFNQITNEYSWDPPAEIVSARSSSNPYTNGIPASPISLSMSQQSGNTPTGSTYNESASFASSETFVNPAINNRLPEGWSIFENDDRTIYYNSRTKETRYTHPNEYSQPQMINYPQSQMSMQYAQSTPSSVHSGEFSAGILPLSPGMISPKTPQTAQSTNSQILAREPSLRYTGDGLPKGWGKKRSPEGRLYYYNFMTNETTWYLEDINKETGELLNRNGVSELPLTESNNDSMGRNQSGDDDDTKAWQRLTRDITTAINQLNLSAKENMKEKFIPQSTMVVESVRVMLHASGARKFSPMNSGHRSLKQNHKQIMSSLSELVMQAKNASAVWPPPDSNIKMQTAANEVLVAVRQFSAAAQEIGIEVKDVEGAMSAVAAAPVEISKAQLVRSVSQSESFPTKDVTTKSHDQGPSPTNSELLSQLETQNKSVGRMISTLVKSVRAPDFNQAHLVPQVRAMVKEVGNFLAVVDEIPLDTLNEEFTVDFKVNRLALYNSISGLVMATQTATSQYAPSNAVEHVILSTGLVEKAVKDLLISTKFLIEEQESVEQEKLMKFIQNVQKPSDAERRPKSLPASQHYAENNSDDIENVQGGPPRASLPSIPVSGHRPISSGPKSAGAVLESGPDFDEGEDSGKGDGGNHKIKKFFGVDNVPVAENSEKPSFLGYDYDPSDLVFGAEGKVKGGTLEALVERLTAHDTSDLNYMSAFLLTFRSFCSSSQLFELLLKRYTLQPPAGLTPEQLDIWRRDKLDTIRTRVYNVLKNWIEKYWLNDEDDNTTLIRIREMAETLIKSHRDAEGLRIVALCNQRAQAGEGGLIKPLKPNNISQTPTPIVPRSLKRIKFLELDPLEVARQLTIMVSRIYERIQPVELLKKAWVEQDNSVAINARTMIAVSNQITGWVVHTILNEKKVKERSYYIRLFIAIAEKCRSLNNFDTLMAILCGLEAAPIHRLKRTWELIKNREMNVFESLRGLMSSTKNFSKYRDELKSCAPPCIPFLGFYFTDLTFIEDGNPDTLKNTNLINFAKRMKTAEVIRDIQQYQLSFALAEVKELQIFLTNALQDGHDEIDTYEKSCELEPKERWV